jgi:hypothetical protein
MPADDLDPERVARAMRALAVGEVDPTTSWCSACAQVVGVRGAGIVLVSRTARSGATGLASVCVSDSTIEAVEDAQYTSGEGPCVDAFRSRSPISEPDLGDGGVQRWPVFGAQAVRLGMRAAFGFPMLVHSVCIGAVNLYDDEVGPLSADRFADALAVAHVAARTVLGWQSAAPLGALAWQLEQLPAHGAVIHQATGMVAVQARLSIPDAQVLLRAFAFAEDRAVKDVARDVVARVVRFD